MRYQRTRSRGGSGSSWELSAIAFPGSALLVAVGGAGAWLSNDEGRSWMPRSEGIDPNVTGLQEHPERSDRVYATTGGGLFRSEDGGFSWLQSISGLDRSVAHSAAVLPGAPDAMVLSASRRAGGSGGALFRSIDGGVRWIRLILGDEDEWAEAPLVASLPGSRDTVFALVDGVIWASHDRGGDWRPLTDPPARPPPARALPRHRALSARARGTTRPPGSLTSQGLLGGGPHMLAQRARRLLPVLLAALVLSLAACSGGGDEGPARPVTAPIAATATATPTPIASSTPTPSPTATPAATPAPTESPLPSPTATPTPSPTSTATLTPTPTEPPTTFPYDTYDTTGAVAEPGSYAFLADPADTASAVTTYEGLRDGTATALRIHETDADGVSRAAFLDTVEVGDLFEWRQAEDCFVRYTVTEVLPDPRGRLASCLASSG